MYYPQGREFEAWRFLTRIEGCVDHLRGAAHIHNGVSNQKIVAILPELAFNNAFVTPRFSGYESLAVVPTYDTLDMFSLEMGLPPDPAVIGCHEITHYVQFQQIAGFAWLWNLFGRLYTPQIGLRLPGSRRGWRSTTRPSCSRASAGWPGRIWRGSSPPASRAALPRRRSHVVQRDFYAGNHYLVRQPVRPLPGRALRRGQLWQLIAVQARSIFFPLWVNLRFWQAYDKTLSTLIGEFADEVAAHLPARDRPPDQRVIRAGRRQRPLRPRPRRQRGAASPPITIARPARRLRARRAAARRSAS